MKKTIYTLFLLTLIGFFIFGMDDSQGTTIKDAIKNQNTLVEVKVQNKVKEIIVDTNSFDTTLSYREPTPIDTVSDIVNSSNKTATDILNKLITEYPILNGTTVEYGNAKGYQAICYYQSGRIVINPTHTRSLEVILNHEIWHVIDWRDNNKIDWQENIPPANKSDYQG